ncbi:DUF1715-domain-containing protein [Cylindrobasidium torrendii FP15055 ss-10]|uniref:DUF1715-domain-containing protein n=1 Tax=Cylindrobasidium torrendii FP15055 ss-10 TaxID=1314674 RepID=A0A0D7B1B7_9AGAR|nr:DUF1715-domain-containing protein [Cylindrobasidium torrendii FP15055 ss-10]
MDFDLESLVHVEQDFYDAGYTDGYEHGRIHGLIEGRALGREKGFEMWEELGFYEGLCKTWRSVLEMQGKQDSRATHHITHLLDLISKFPSVNPSQEDAETNANMDISRLLRLIRSRYKALCASLGIVPSLRATDAEGGSDEDAPTTTRKSVWKVNAAPKAEDMSF